jgi:hypothetical protein
MVMLAEILGRSHRRRHGVYAGGYQSNTEVLCALEQTDSENT